MTTTAVNTEPISRAELDVSFPMFRGELVLPHEPAYEQRRLIWNRLFDDVRPAVVARCSGTSDVQDVVNFARETGHPLAIRGGGHSLAGKSTCQDGVVLDLSLMRHCWVDQVRETIHVGGGATWGDLDREAAAFGFVAPGGALSITGVGGVTLGGGFGWLVRRFGLCLDNVVSMDVVTAAGKIVTCNEDRHADLFWALRGGGGNFAVVTNFELGLHRINPDILTGVLGWPIEDAPDVLRFYGPIAPDFPREIGLNAQLVVAPPMAEIPVELHGKPILILIYAHHGDDHSIGAAAIDRLREYRAPAFDTTALGTYLELQRSNDFRCLPGRSCWQTGYLDELGPAIEDIVAQFADVPSAMCLSEFLTMSGAISDVPEDATAFRRRDGWVYNVITIWEGEKDDDLHLDWAHRYQEAMLPYASDGAYINFFSAGEDHRVLEAYGPEKLARLRKIKRVYDPENLFRVNHNIEPAAVW